MSRKGGTERMTALIANALSARHSVFVISLRMVGGGVSFPLDGCVQHSVLDNGAGKTGAAAQIRMIRRFIKENKIDCVINVDVGMGFYGIIAARGTGAKVITWEHGNYFNNWGSRWFPYFRRFAARHSDAMVVLTERDKQNYMTNISRCRPVTVIGNPVEKHPVDYRSDSRTILSAGHLAPVKRFTLIPEVGRTVFARHPDWQWRICGEGPERAEIERKIAEYGLSKNIILAGSVSDMETEYRSAAMYVMTSGMEGLPMVLLEAKSYGLPLVSFDIMTGPGEIIRDGVNGYLVQSGDTAALAEKICRLIENEELRRDFSENSQVDIERFDFNSITDAWEELITR
ncbi:MAG: glycosyltransferase family 4 protein [Eubacteriales bacterium]